MSEDFTALAGLDDVPWAELPLHSRSAEDIPGMLRAVADPEKGDVACWELDSALVRQGSLSWPVVIAVLPFLVRLAADEKVTCRAEILGMLIMLTADEPDDPQWNEAWAKAVPVVGMLLDDPDPMVRQTAAEALAITDDVNGTIWRAFRWRWAAETDRAVRLNLVLAVGDLAPPEVESWMEERLSDADRQVQLAAALSFRPERHLDVLIEALSEPELDVWRGVHAVDMDAAGVVSWAGSTLGDDVGGRVRLVAGLIGHEDPRRRLGALYAAATLLNERRSAVAALLPMIAPLLEDGEVEIRALAVQLVAGLGPEASEYAGALAAMLGDETIARGDVQFADLALWGLARMGDSRCVAPLLARLEGNRLGYSYYSVGFPRDSGTMIEVPGIHEVLWEVPQYADTLIRGVGRRLLMGDHLHAWRPFAEVVAAWGPAAAKAVTQVRPLLHSEAPSWAAEALAAIGPAGAATKRLLRKLAQDSHLDPRHRWPAAGALAMVTGKSKQATEILGLAVADPAGAERHTAARHLGTLGPAAAAYAGWLRVLMAGDELWERVEAANALWQVAADPDGVTALLDVVGSATEFRPAVQRAVKYLATIKPLPAAAEPVLRAVLDRDERLAGNGSWRVFAEDQEIRRHLAAALAGMR
ncbi:MAG: hypothetical protein QOI21_4977 [Actinomycetota bacterium]|nr:hypothetical protein [Actinomycetota bacterium]